MAVLLVTVTLQRDSLLPEDVVVNTWHFETADDIPANIALAALAIHTDLDTFYQAVDVRLATMLNGIATLRAYNLGDPEPRVPVLLLDLTPLVPGGTSYPGEVALVLSFAAVIASGDIAARRKNRIFFGPMAADGTNTPGDLRPTIAVVTTFVTAADALLTSAIADPDYTWVTFSPTIAGPKASDGTFPNLTDGTFPVNNGWMDDAYDTIRSRGARPLVRQTFTA